MRRANLGNWRFAGSSWAANMDQGWETKDEIRAAFEAKGLAFSERKLERWLEEGLLPPADQIPLAYRGSEVRYLPGTAAQAIAIQELLGEKRKFNFVGWEDVHGAMRGLCGHGLRNLPRNTRTTRTKDKWDISFME